VVFSLRGTFFVQIYFMGCNNFYQPKGCLCGASIYMYIIKSILLIQHINYAP
jgi:hypothetical protein